MNPTPDPPDPLSQSLADEAADLPRLAASETRRIRAARTQQRQLLFTAMTVVTLGICGWKILFPSGSTTGRETRPQPTLAQQSESTDYIKVQTPEEARSAPLSLPPGLNEEQKQLLVAAGDLPLMLVKDDSGKVVSIHVIER